jgi:hypothetical protein
LETDKDCHEKAPKKSNKNGWWTTNRNLRGKATRAWTRNAGGEKAGHAADRNSPKGEERARSNTWFQMASDRERTTNKNKQRIFGI